MKFVIDRAKWRCGGSVSYRMRGLGNTYMLNDQGFMCCLGQCSKQLGACDEQQMGMRTPQSVFERGFRQLVGVLLDGELEDWVTLPTGTVNLPCHSQLAVKAMEINDDTTINQHKREALLTNVFQHYGHELEFVGECVIKYPEMVEMYP